LLGEANVLSSCPWWNYQNVLNFEMRHSILHFSTHPRTLPLSIGAKLFAKHKKREENNVAKEPPEKREESSGHFVNIFHVYFSGESRRKSGWKEAAWQQNFSTHNIFLVVRVCMSPFASLWLYISLRVANIFSQQRFC